MTEEANTGVAKANHLEKNELLARQLTTTHCFCLCFNKLTQQY